MTKRTLIQRMMRKGAPKSWIGEIAQMLRKIDALEETKKEYLDIIDELATKVSHYEGYYD